MRLSRRGREAYSRYAARPGRDDPGAFADDAF